MQASEAVLWPDPEAVDEIGSMPTPPGAADLDFGPADNAFGQGAAKAEPVPVDDDPAVAASGTDVERTEVAEHVADPEANPLVTEVKKPDDPTAAATKDTEDTPDPTGDGPDVDPVA